MKENVFYEVSVAEKFDYGEYMDGMIDEFLMDWYMVLADDDDGIPKLEELVTMVLSEVNNSAIDLMIGVSLGKNIADLEIEEVNNFIELKANSDINEVLFEEGYSSLFSEDEVVDKIYERIAKYKLLLEEEYHKVIINSPEWWDVW